MTSTPRKLPSRPVSRKQMASLRQHPESGRQMKNVEGCCKALVDLHSKTASDLMDRDFMKTAVKSNPFLMGSLERINKHGMKEGILQRPVTAEELAEWLHAISMRQRLLKGKSKPKQ